MDEAIVDKVAARIVARINGEAIDTRPRSVIAIFSGAVSGFAAGREAVSRLVCSPHALSVLLTPSARRIFGEAPFHELGAAAILDLEPWADVSEHIQRADLVLVPTLTMSLAARLALGVMDSPAATLILGALLGGKSVLGIRDGADPAGQRGVAMGAIPAGSSALWSLLETRLETLASFGMQLTSKEDFLFALERRLIAATGVKPKLPAAAATPAGPLPNIVTSLEIQEQAPGSRMVIARGRRLTPQASDFAARRGLQLEFA